MKNANKSSKSIDFLSPILFASDSVKNEPSFKQFYPEKPQWGVELW